MRFSLIFRYILFFGGQYHIVTAQGDEITVLLITRTIGDANGGVGFGQFCLLLLFLRGQQQSSAVVDDIGDGHPPIAVIPFQNNGNPPPDR